MPRKLAGFAAQPGLKLSAKCAAPKALQDPNPCAQGLYCSISKGACQARIPKGGDCAAYLPNRSCREGLYCKPSAGAWQGAGRAPGKCAPHILGIGCVGYDGASCEHSGPADQCDVAKGFVCTLPPSCGEAPWIYMCQEPVPKDVCDGVERP